MFHIIIATNDDELEAELLALTGKKKGSGKKSKGSEASLSLADIDKMVASVKDMGEGEEDEGSLSDIDDDELLAELQVYCMHDYTHLYKYMHIHFVTLPFFTSIMV